MGSAGLIPDIPGLYVRQPPGDHAVCEHSGIGGSCGRQDRGAPGCAEAWGVAGAAAAVLDAGGAVATGGQVCQCAGQRTDQAEWRDDGRACGIPCVLTAALARPALPGDVTHWQAWRRPIRPASAGATSTHGRPGVSQAARAARSKASGKQARLFTARATGHRTRFWILESWCGERRHELGADRDVKRCGPGTCLPEESASS